MEMIYEILDKLYAMTAFSAIGENPLFIVMYLLAFTLLYLGIVKKYEPLLLVPIAFGVLIANFPVVEWVCCRLTVMVWSKV